MKFSEFQDTYWRLCGYLHEKKHGSGFHQYEDDSDIARDIRAVLAADNPVLFEYVAQLIDVPELHEDFVIEFLSSALDSFVPFKARCPKLSAFLYERLHRADIEGMTDLEVMDIYLRVPDSQEREALRAEIACTRSKVSMHEVETETAIEFRGLGAYDLWLEDLGVYLSVEPDLGLSTLEEHRRNRLASWGSPMRYFKKKP
jgi:hypothetical protein